MILTGPKMQEIAHTLYGDVWVSVLADKLDRSKRTIMRWRDGKHPMPREMRDHLLHMVETQIADLDAHRNFLTAPLDDAA